MDSILEVQFDGSSSQQHSSRRESTASPVGSTGSGGSLSTPTTKKQRKSMAQNVVSSSVNGALTQWSTTAVVGTTLAEKAREEELEQQKVAAAKRREGLRFKSSLSSSPRRARSVLPPPSSRPNNSGGGDANAKNKKPVFNAWDRQLSRTKSGTDFFKRRSTSAGGKDRPLTENEKRIQRLNVLRKKLEKRHEREMAKEKERNALKISLQPIGPPPKPIPNMGKLEQMVNQLSAPTRGPQQLPPPQLRMYS